MNEVKITYFNEERTEYLVDYGAKRRFNYAPPPADLDAVAWSLLTLVYEGTLEEVNPKALARMSDVKVYQLVERFATSFCYEHSPKANAGLEKKWIRWAVLKALHEVQGAR